MHPVSYRTSSSARRLVVAGLGVGCAGEVDAGLRVVIGGAEYCLVKARARGRTELAQRGTASDLGEAAYLAHQCHRVEVGILPIDQAVSNGDDVRTVAGEGGSACGPGHDVFGHHMVGSEVHPFVLEMKIRHESEEFVDELSDGRKSVGGLAETVHLETDSSLCGARTASVSCLAHAPEYAPANSVIFMLIGSSRPRREPPERWHPINVIDNGTAKATKRHPQHALETSWALCRDRSSSLFGDRQLTQECRRNLARVILYALRSSVSGQSATTGASASAALAPMTK